MLPNYYGGTLYLPIGGDLIQICEDFYLLTCIEYKFGRYLNIFFKVFTF